MFLKNVLFTERKEICIFIVQHCIYIKSITCYNLGVHNTTVSDEEQLDSWDSISAIRENSKKWHIYKAPFI